MKFALPLLAMLALALSGRTSSSPLPAPDPHSQQRHASVVLKLNDGRMARCQLSPPRAHHAAQIVSSALVASAKIACTQPGVDTWGPRGEPRGPVVSCESGQNVSTDEANDTIRAACDSSFGVHDVL